MLSLLAGLALGAPLDPASFASLGATQAPAVASTIDTTTLEWTTPGEPAYIGVLDGNVVVFTFDTVDLSHPVDIVGTRPVAILSQGSLTVNATVDATATGSTAGPGGWNGGDIPNPGYYVGGASGEGAGWRGREFLRGGRWRGLRRERWRRRPMERRPRGRTCVR